MMSQPPETWKDIRRPSAKLAATLETLQSGNAQHKPSAVHDMTGEAGSYAYMAPE